MFQSGQVILICKLLKIKIKMVEIVVAKIKAIAQVFIFIGHLVEDIIVMAEQVFRQVMDKTFPKAEAETVQ